MTSADRPPSRPREPAVQVELFNRVSTDRISTVIVDRIRHLIREGELRPGARLPAERDLCDRFGVSRVVVREALRALEAVGLVEIRVGVRGGAVVTAPSAERVGEGITDLLTLSALSAVDVTEARRVLEVAFIPLVCERADETDLRELGDLCDRAEAALAEGGYRADLSSEFHCRLAAATHNAAIAMLAHTFREPVAASLDRARDADPGTGRRGVREHRALIAMIRDRDVDAATSIMSRHLDRTAARVADTGPPAAWPDSGA